MQSHLFFGGPATRTVKSLIIANIAVFLSQLAFRHLFNSSLIEDFFGLSPWNVTHNLTLWQFATYMFLHGGVGHIFFNMLTLYMFGNELVRYWSPRRFLIYYFVTGIGAGFCSWIVATRSLSIVIGASGAIYGLLLAYGLTYPNRIVYLNFLFPIRVKWLVVIMGAVAFLSSITGSDSGVANIAHLGGMAVGYLFLKGRDWRDRYRAFDEKRRREQLKQQFEVYYGDVRRKIERDNNKKDSIH
jgi:membrane associated rhomboid family serine protease